MIITYPDSHRWEKIVSDDVFKNFGKNNTARLRSSLARLETFGIRYEFVDLTAEIISWFEPWYHQTINTKENPKLSPIYETTIGKANAYPYKILILKEQGDVVGAIVFSVRPTIISIAYRIFKPNWNTAIMQANPALFGEYAMSEYTHTQGITLLSHGKDRNPYGLNANIGLALFKLSVGCRVTTPKGPYEILSIDTDTITTDILIMEQPATGKDITRAYLYATPDTQSKFIALQKYSETLEVITLTRVP
jgi:hypothetical protein